MQDSAQRGDVPEVLHVEAADLRRALALGWRDFLSAPHYGLFFACFYVAGGWLVYWSLTAKGALWWTLPAAAGFPLLGPFVACGLYEVSRRLEQGLPLRRAEVFTVIFRQKDRQIPSMAAVIVIFFLFWNFLAHMIFAVFLGHVTLVNVTSSLALFATPQGLAMLAVGTAAGALISLVFFSITVVSLPMLLEREVDYVTAMLTSVALVRESPLVMILWGAMIGLGLLLALLPGFFGLFLALPVFGHASWHLYRAGIAWEGQG